MLTKYSYKLKKEITVLYPGDYYATKKDQIIGTTLGSCIGVCLFDQVNRISGMNHFLLSGELIISNFLQDKTARYGQYAMEILIGEMVKIGARRERMIAKVFGGAHMLKSMGTHIKNKVSNANIVFIRQYLKLEEIPCVAEDSGGESARKIMFFTNSGKVLVKKSDYLNNQNNILTKEYEYQKNIIKEQKIEKVTFFK